jgi:hypothetical protein
MGTWSLAGNALGNPPQGVLGTTDSNALVLETSGTERLRIDAAGNVGVNNPSPQGTFDVNGNRIILGLQANVGGQLHIGNNANDNRIWLEAWSATAAPMPPKCSSPASLAATFRRSLSTPTP